MGVIRGRVDALRPQQLTRVTVDVHSAGQEGSHSLRPDRGFRFGVHGLPDEAPVRIVVRSIDAAVPLARLAFEDATDRDLVVAVGAVEGSPTARVQRAEAAIADRDAAEPGRRELLTTELDRVRDRRRAAWDVGRLVRASSLARTVTGQAAGTQGLVRRRPAPRGPAQRPYGCRSPLSQGGWVAPRMAMAPTWCGGHVRQRG